MGSGWREYERLTQSVFQAICDLDTSVGTIDVQHDVKIQGKTTTHQVDVYWEFGVGGFTHKTIIQCKDWADAVDQGELIKLKGVLDDVPGQPRGAVVTRTGFQSGAREYAAAHGILLYELREPKEEDWENRLRGVEITMEFFVPRARDFQLEPDREWVEQDRKRRGMPEGEHVSVSFARPAGELVFVDERGEPSMTAAGAILAMFPREHAEFAERIETFHFRGPTYLETDDPRLPRIRLKSASATIAQGRIQEKMFIDFASLPKLILRNVIQGTVEHMFDKDLHVLGAGDADEGG